MWHNHVWQVSILCILSVQIRNRDTKTMKVPSINDYVVKVRAYLTDEVFGYTHWRAAQFSAPKHTRFGVLVLFETEGERDKFFEREKLDGAA